MDVPSQFQAKNRQDVSLANCRVPGVCFVLVGIIVCTRELILAQRVICICCYCSLIPW